MRVLGISFETHDTGVALVENGDILCAINEERLSRIKSDGGTPVLALRECLKMTNTHPEQIEVLALAGFPPFKNLKYYGHEVRELVRFTLGKSVKAVEFGEWGERKDEKGLKAIILNLALATGLPQYYFLYYSRLKKILKALDGFRGKIVYVPHHMAHISGAYYTSGWDKCVIAVIEGSGWDYTTSLSLGDGGRITSISSTKWPHSAGRFYRLVTQVLGFSPRRHGGKITGLAAYGDPDVAYDKVRKLMWVEGLELRVSPLVYEIASDYIYNGRKLPEVYSDCSREDLAAAFQRRLEECVCGIIAEGTGKTGEGRLALVGGVVANVKLNKKIHELEDVGEIYIHPGMGDLGVALGTALFAVNQEMQAAGNYLKPKKMVNVFWGSEYGNDEIRKMLDEYKLNYKFCEDPEAEVAELLSRGRIVARFSGRMEYGPRSLGNRSILYNAEDASVNDWLNERLGRTEFMPFAPSTLIEYADRCYENVRGSEYTAEFMTITYTCTDWMRRKCPAVVHVDNTARPQLVDKVSNPGFYKILKHYFELTGIPTVLNTSFNMHEEPIVCTPEDAVRAFMQAELDVLAIGNYLVYSGS